MYRHDTVFPLTRMAGASYGNAFSGGRVFLLIGFDFFFFREEMLS